MDTQLTNFLRATGFTLSIEGLEFRGIEFACVKAQIPARILPEVAINFRGTQTFESGDQITAQDFPVEFLVAKDLSNYLALDEWITRSLNTREFHDMTLSILSPQNNVIKQIHLIDAIPVQLGSLDFDTRITTPDSLTVAAVFRYTRHEFV